MTKLSFLISLREKLSGLPESEIEERLRFYSEMIEDRVEEGYSEEDAVAAVGSVDEIAAHIKAEFTPEKAAKKNTSTQKSTNAWNIVLLIVGFPLWFSLLITLFAVAFSIYISIWSVIVSLWSVFGAVIVCAVFSLLSGAVFALTGKGFIAMALISAGLVLGGIGILMFYLSKFVTSGTVWLTGKVFAGIKRCFTRKESV